jgi:hypothetical protein
MSRAAVLPRKISYKKAIDLSESLASKQTVASQSKVSQSKLGGLASKSKLQAKLAEQ